MSALMTGFLRNYYWSTPSLEEVHVIKQSDEQHDEKNESEESDNERHYSMNKQMHFDV